MLWLACALAGTPEPPTQPVRVATFNVWGLPWPLAPRRAKRLRAIDTWLDEGRFDVVALQEVWRGARSHLDSVRYPRSEGDSGLGLYSRHPFERLEFIPFASERGPDKWKNKGIWWVRLDLPEAPCVLGIVHLQAGTGSKRAAVRQQQVAQLLESIPDGPVLLLGDFNLHRGSAIDRQTHQTLVDAGLREARPVQDRGTSRYGTHRLDRMYVSLPASWTVSRARTRRDIGHSDHFPVELELLAP